jgi:RNA polymerase sigma-70 factor (sigma-E family)
MTWEHGLTELVSAKGAALTRYAYLLSGDANEAADLVQDALLRTFSRVSLGVDLDNAEAYVRRAILRDYIDRQRRRARWRSVRHLFAGERVQPPVDDGVIERCDLHSALARLSPRQRACVVLRYYQDCPVADIADQLGCGVGTVKRHLSDAVARLALVTEDPERGVTR